MISLTAAMGSAVEQPGAQAGAERPLPGMAVKAERREQTRLPVRSKKGRKRAHTGTTGKRRAYVNNQCVCTLFFQTLGPWCKLRNLTPPRTLELVSLVMQ